MATMYPQVFPNLSATADEADLLPSTTVLGGSRVSVQLSGTFSATIEVQVSNDGAAWVAIETASVAATGTPLTSLTAAGVYAGSFTARFLRVHVTGYVSGTVNGAVVLS